MSVHGPVHGPVHSPVHGPWSRLYTNPLITGHTSTCKTTEPSLRSLAIAALTGFTARLYAYPDDLVIHVCHTHLLPHMVCI